MSALSKLKNRFDYSKYACPYSHVDKECGHELKGPEGYEDTYGVWCACGFRGPVFCLEPDELKLVAIKNTGGIMDIKIAAKETQIQILEVPAWRTTQDASLGRLHVSGLLDYIISGKVTGEKANRWLGWAQAALVMTGYKTLADVKDINHKA